MLEQQKAYCLCGKRGDGAQGAADVQAIILPCHTTDVHRVMHSTPVVLQELWCILAN